MESITRMVQDQDNMELDQLLIGEDQHLEKNREQEQEQQELHLDQELIMQMQTHLIKEEGDLEMLHEMEEIQSVTPQDQDSIKVLILLVEMDQNRVWEEGIICLRV